MATFTWIGNSGTFDANDASQAANYTPSGGPPGNSDTLIVGTGATLTLATAGSVTGLTLQAAGSDTFNFTDQNFISSRFTFGNSTTLNLTGTARNTAGFDIGSNGGTQSQIRQTGSAAALTVNAIGTMVSNAFIYLDQPNGSLTFNVSQNGTARGELYSQGAIFNLGGTLTIIADTGNSGNRFSNAGYMMLGSQNGTSFTKLNGRMDGTRGVIELAAAATGAILEIATNMPGAQIVAFGAGNNGTVVIDATTTLGSYANVGVVTTTVLQNSFERFNEFGPGNTIDLAGVSVAGLTYSFGDPTWGANVLTLVRNGSTVVARLRFTNSSAFADGAASNFVLAADSAGTGTAITVNAAPVSVVNAGTTYAVGGTAAVFNSPTVTGTLDWGTAGNWTGGAAAGLPGQFQAVVITNSLAQIASFASYQLNVSGTQAAGGLSFSDHFAKLRITGALTLAAAPGQSSGGGLVQTAGTVNIAAGGTVTARNVTSSSQLTLEAGASLAVSGVAPFTLGSGLAGLSLEDTATFSGATVTSGGNIIIGANASATVSAITSTGTASSVTATYTVVGAGAATDPNQSNGTTSSSLTINGPGTVWRDVGGDSTTPLSGAMLVGGGGASVNALGTVSVPAGGNGTLIVDQAATLIDSGFAILGLFNGSNGSVNVQNAAKWIVNTSSLNLPGTITIGSTNISSGGPPPILSVGYQGTGSLNVANSATVSLGSQPLNANQYGLAIGVGAGNLSQTTRPGGTVTVNAALLDSSLASISIGQRGDGVLSISNGGTVLAGNGGGIGFGVVLGSRSYVLAGTTTASTGTLIIGGGAGTSALISSSDFINGRDGIGSVTISNGGSLAVTGRYFEGGSAAGRGTATNTGSNFLVQGGSVSISNGATIFGGSHFDLEAGAVGISSAGTLVNGNIIVGASGTLTMLGNGAGSQSVLTNNVVGGSLANAGLIQALNGTLEIAANVAGAGSFLASSGGLVKFDRLVGNTTTVSLGGTLSTGTVELLTPISFQGTIDNFWGAASGPANMIKLDGIGTSAPVLTWTQIDAAHGTLDVTMSGTHATTLTITGYHPGAFIQSGAPGINGLVISAVDTAPCFAAGTRIRTSRGDVAVETLAVGDIAYTASGNPAPIVWIGHRRVVCASHPRPWDVNPVRIAPHAFAPNQPSHDLWLSPDHAVFRDGVLIPIRYLINGATIIQEPRDTVTYFHVELAAHAILLAEGLPAESFLDTGNRGAFANGGGAVMMHPDFALKTWDAEACAPLAVDGPAVHAARADLLERAAMLGHAMSDDPDLHLLADGRVIRPDWIGDEIGFVLPEHFTVLRLVSRDFAPAEILPTSDDRRRLGVAVTSLILDGETITPEAGNGWCAAEDGLQWTDGDALISARTGAVLEVRIAGIGRYWNQASSGREPIYASQTSGTKA